MIISFGSLVIRCKLLFSFCVCECVCVCLSVCPCVCVCCAYLVQHLSKWCFLQLRQCSSICKCVVLREFSPLPLRRTNWRRTRPAAAAAPSTAAVALVDKESQLDLTLEGRHICDTHLQSVPMLYTIDYLISELN